jgi:hypothetical protein
VDIEATIEDAQPINVSLGEAVNIYQGGTDDYNKLDNKPTLGTAAATDSTDYATAAQGAKADTATQPADIANFETTTQLNTRDTNNRNTDNHTSGTTNKVFTATEQTKLSGIATSATANSADAHLLARANHTGTQTASTISDFTTTAASAAPVQSVAGKTGTVSLAKADVGLGNVDNTSDTNKPVSTAQQTALNAKLNIAGGSLTGGLTLESTYTGGDNTSDSTSRITTQSHQKGVRPNHFAETIRMDLMRDGAKNMIAWRDSFTDPSDPKTIAWVGAHYLSNDGLSEHKHFSIEVSDSTEQLQTRLEIPYGLDHTNIKTSSADFVVSEGKLRVSGGNSAFKDVQYATHPEDATKIRWALRTDNTTESGSNVGSDFRYVRYNDSGTAVDSPLFIQRSNGRIGLGNQTSPSEILDVNGSIRSGTASNGTIIADRAASTNFASFSYRTAGTEQFAIGLRNDSTNDFHFRNTANGNTAILIERRATAPNMSLLTNTKSYGGGVGVLFLPNASTIPSTNPSGGGIMFVEGGALKWRGSSGTVTTIAAA